MSKYIPADKLIAEIERRKADAKLYDMSGGDAPIYDELLSIVTSLQQDLPRWKKLPDGIMNQVRLMDKAIIVNHHYILYSDLEKLPGFKKD